MEESYGIRERKEYYACVIDLLCRVGRLEEAYNIIKDMPVEVTDSIIGAFFSGCVRSIQGEILLKRWLRIYCRWI